MVQSSKVRFVLGVLVFSALLNDSISYARRDIFLRSNNEESIINKKEPGDEELNKITIAHIKTDCFKESEQKTLSHDTFTKPMYDTKDAGEEKQVSGENNSPRKYFRERKEDMRTSSDFKPSFNLPGNRIDGNIPFTSDYNGPTRHTPRHN